MFWTVAAQALRWSLHCYRRHWPLVLGLSLIPAAQRLLITWPDLDPPTWIRVLTEILAQGSRVALVAAALVLMLREASPGPVRLQPAWERFEAGIDQHLAVFLAQFLLLAGAFVVFDLLPNAAITLWVPADSQDIARAWLIAAKNPTVIALTLLWMVGVVRAFMLLDSSEPTPHRRAG